MPAPNLQTNLNIVQLPGSYPNVGGSTGLNTIVTDPDFGATIVRLTDITSGTGNFESLQTADDPSGYGIWNTDDTLLLCRNTSGVSFPFQFNPTTMQGQQLGSSGPYHINGAVCFSKVNPGILYNCPQGGTAVNQITFALVGGIWTYQSTTPYCDFANILPGPDFHVTWQGELEVSFYDEVMCLGFSNAGNQNTGVFCCLYNGSNGGYRMLETDNLAVTEFGTSWGAVGTATLVNFGSVTYYTLHGTNQPANPAYTQMSAPGVIGAIQWINTGLTVTSTGLSGHHGVGYIAEYTGNPGGGQYDVCFFTTPTQHAKIIPIQAGPPGLPANQTPPQSYTGDQHSAFGPINTTDESLLWITNGQPSVFPFTSCWMGEVRGLDVTGAISGAQGTVYRLCHTFNSGLANEYITQNAMCIPSQTGNFVAFNSDWAGAAGLGGVAPLGSTAGDPTGIVGTNGRGDVFIAQIPYPGGTAPSITSPNTVTFYTNTASMFAVTTTASPTAALTETGSLPPGITFVDNGDGTGILSGTTVQEGTFPITFSATNGVSPDASQPFILYTELIPVPPTPPLSPNSNQWGPYFQNTGTPPIEYGNEGVSSINPWGIPVPGVDSPLNTNVEETVPLPPAGGIANPSNNSEND